jgi:hypothetical protein
VGGKVEKSSRNKEISLSFNRHGTGIARFDITLGINRPIFFYFRML